MRHKRFNKWRYSLVWFMLPMILIAQGCFHHQSATHIKAFSVASANLADQTIKVYELTDRSTVDRKIIEIAVYSEKELRELDRETIDKIKGVFSDNKKIDTCMIALNGIKEYAKAIGDLSSADYSGDIKKASCELYGSLTSLNKAYKDLSNKDLGIAKEDFALFASLINAIGEAIVETKRRKAIKDIVIKTNPQLIKVCDEIASSVENNKVLTNLDLNTIYAEKVESYKSDVKSKKIIKLNDKVSRIKELMQCSRICKKSETVFKDVKEAVEKVKRAHGVLYESVKKDKFTTPELTKEIGELVAFAKEMKKYYDDLLDPEKEKK